MLLAGSLNQVWGMVNNLQIVVHTPLINVQFPANAFLLYDVMISVATFDILPTDDVYPYLFPDLPENDAFNDKFDRLQIGSRYLVMNMGTLLLVFTFYVALFIVYPCCNKLGGVLQCARNNATKIRAMLFWSHPIVFIQESYLDILLAGSVNLYFIQGGELKWDNWSLVFTNLLTVTLVSGCGILFLFVLLYLWPRFD